MEWQIESIDKKNKILIINLTDNKVVSQFKNFLISLSSAKVFFLTKMISQFNNFDYVFVFENHKITFSNIKKNKKKVIFYKGNLLNQKSFDQILWFCFSSASVATLHLTLPQTKTDEKKNDWKKNLSDYFSLTKKRLFITAIFLFIIFNSFIFFTFIADYFFYLSLKNLTTNPWQAKNYLSNGEKLLYVAKKNYQPFRFVYHLLGFGVFFDNLIGFSEEANNFLNNLNNLKTTAGDLFELVNNQEIINNRVQLGNQYVKNFNNLLNSLESNLLNINQKAPFFIIKNHQFKSLTQETYSLITGIKKITKNLDKILGFGNKKRYLILFANNRELRPGGGFIGSFAVLEFKNYKKEVFTLYDVYDADGQLKVHIEPPSPIKTYLNQPHWFLRDSAFSPDFEENFKTAEFFLEKELKLEPFDAGIIITTSAIENILKAFGELYIPDYKEKINSSNFYLKTQLYTEKNFFPGSIQKKSFLNSLMQQIIANFNRISITQLVKEIKKSLDEKHIAFYFKDNSLQKEIDSSLWSGKLVFPDCIIKNYFCINNYFFPFDANLGVNKADYFVDKSIFLKIILDKRGKITNYLTVSYRNNSPSNLFPGGDYKNFFQIYLPKQINIKSINKDGIAINNYFHTQENELNLLSFYFELKPKKTTEIKIVFENQQSLKEGKNVLQLILQKQIGALNKDFILEINLPQKISLINSNFLPLVNKDQIVYNSILNTDKIYYLIFDKR